MYGLREKDERIVANVLEDVKKSVTCEIGIGGSLAQRALSPQIATQLEGKPLHDIDLILIGVGQKSPALPSLHKDFNVKEKIADTGWYFGLTHRKTGMWVDLFTPAYERKQVRTPFAGSIYTAETIESQILYLGRNILERIQDSQSVRRKWQNKLLTLMSLHDIDTEGIASEYAAHIEYFAGVLPSYMQVPAQWKEYCAIALAQKPTPLWKDVWRGFLWQFWLRKRHMNTDRVPEAVV